MAVQHHSVLIPRDGGEMEVHPLKEWLRRHPEENPTGLDPSRSTSHQLRNALRRAGWTMHESPTEICMIHPGARAPSEIIEEVSRPEDSDVTTDWFWEGNVVEFLSTYLSGAGWKIISKANTRSKERGVDIHASKDDTDLLVEAKGYPSTSYRDPKRSGELKRTNPSLQAQQWYSHALLKALRLQTEYPNAIVALAFPDFPRYRTLFQETQIGLKKLGLVMLTVKRNGEVESWGLEQA
jgi:hypothetical protein